MHPQPPEDLTGLVDGFASTLQAVLEIGMTCHDDDFGRATQCPGWTVKDQISHVVGLELAMQGERAPQVPVPDYDWLRSEVGHAVEPAVELRRSRSGSHVVAELAALLPARLEALRGPELRLDTQVDGPFGRTDLGSLLRMRTIDVWCHEQDLRQALDRPGNLDTAGAAFFCERILMAFPGRAARRAGLEVGTVVIIESTGPVLAREGVRIIEGADGKPYAESLFSGVSHEAPATSAVAPEIVESATSIRLSTDALTRRGAGRVPTQELHYTVDGDEDVARKVLDALVITP
ncbi:maleylpyruvate isomerase family mycothiol-dependent enzyme [Leekyejoonella antrihumi]|uniref:Maleylpyruvate isomerase family mycothiol-dependent enzyme n=1 Tax=Leekyejoonella antrihumi TaxID=1660198 RepID=A0A563E6R7_9MICO|nr:maleylpyruvate isomerase family mycothiol-dependent enzyme [Leekyejoonella antrihumi]TWP37953.1 maleylpyruvate isomerase family mycothiol-dependent enzyme [Leekyejoonella antrihumi]